jgi:hypothetical protein
MLALPANRLPNSRAAAHTWIALHPLRQLQSRLHSSIGSSDLASQRISPTL